MKRILLFSLVLGVLFTTTALIAGYYYSIEVSVYTTSTGSGYMHGDFKSARNSSDTTQQIRCYISSSGSVGCYARDTDGDYATATSTNSVYYNIVQSLSDFGYIYVSFDEDANITSMTVHKGSSFLPLTSD